MKAIVGAHEHDTAPILKGLARAAGELKAAPDIQLLIERRIDRLVASILSGLLLV